MTDWVVDLIDKGGELAVFLLMFLETVFPPIPSELIMSLAGIRAGQGQMSLTAIIVAGTAGAMAGNVFWYVIARWLGIERFKPIIDRWGRWLTITWPEVERGRKWFARYGTFFVFLGRMLPTVRSLVSIPAGMLKMRWRSFLIASTLGTAGWTALLAVAGYQLGSNFEEIDDFLGPISTAIVATLLIAYVWRLWTHRKVGKGSV
ncbi:DedA family protein [Sphingomicrobium astaxanthinifaciens]|uniref:DedA family protein n=1 Tax=Sphingomicrobium astaxanthinifaciens TaxID=1227949 RepID=UPI001FCC269E|nr:DedA family protein [Sphingomicrobium astaxanthinifaciens]MCJ7422000.1 DedA family protein [Sphingomicrobium astaxanthinifaciens]